MNKTLRPAIDIQEDIQIIINNYPPLRESDPYLFIAVRGEGHITFTGNVRTRIIRRVLIDSTRLVPGVKEINDDTLYDDDTLLVQLGAVVPPGIYLTAVNGQVVLSGRAPDEPELLVELVKAVPGVREVKTEFYTTQPKTMVTNPN